MAGYVSAALEAGARIFKVPPAGWLPTDWTGLDGVSLAEQGVRWSCTRGVRRWGPSTLGRAVRGGAAGIRGGRDHRAHGGAGLRGVPAAGLGLRAGQAGYHDDLHRLLRPPGPDPGGGLPLARELGLAGKILLGSDFPNIPYPCARQLAGLARLDLGKNWLRAVCWDNPVALFGAPD